MSDATAAAAGTEVDRGDDADGEGPGRVRRYVDYAILAGLLLLAFVAVVQFYFSASAVITTWVAPEYRAPFRAVFNLAVLLAVGAAVSRHVRRMGDEERASEGDDAANPEVGRDEADE